LGDPSFSPPRGSFHSLGRTIPREHTFSPLGSSLSFSGETLPAHISYLLPRATSPKAKQYFEAKVISIGVVSKDEVELFELSKILFIPNVYILFNLYHGCIIYKPPPPVCFNDILIMGVTHFNVRGIDF
jgi:hypothetical protein